MQAPGKYSADIPDVLKGPSRNVAQVYAQLARDIREDNDVVPDFATALDRHRLVGAIEAAARTRAVQDLS